MPAAFLTRETSFGDRLMVSQPAALSVQNGRSMAAPKPWRRLHGYVEQHGQLKALVERGAPKTVGVWGAGGTGKTEMLVAALGIEGHAWVDGSVMLAARHATASDLIALLTNAVFGVDPRSRPSTEACSAALAGRRLIVGLDDLRSPDDLRVVQAALAHSLVIFTTTQPWDATDVEWIALRGLTTHGVTLVREAAGSLSGEAAATLVKNLDGNPSRLLRAMELGLTPKALLAACRSIEALDDFQFTRVRQELQSSDRDELAAIAVFGEAAIGTKAPSAALVKRGFLERSSAGWAVPSGLRERVRRLPVNETALAATLVVAMDRNPAHINDSRNLLACAAGLCETIERGGEPARDAACDVVRAADRRGLWQVSSELYLRLRAAADALDDQATWAWATHQLAARYACAGDLDGAEALFTAALEVRKKAGGEPAAFLTAANLAQLAYAEVGPGAVEPPQAEIRPPVSMAPLAAALGNPRTRKTLNLAAVAALVLAAFALGWILRPLRQPVSLGVPAARVAALPIRPSPTLGPATAAPPLAAAPTQAPATARAATPRPATPRPATPRPATPRPATPRPATPRPATPAPATPAPAKPALATPHPAAAAAAHTPAPASPAVVAAATASVAQLTVRPSVVAPGQTALLCVAADNATQLHVSGVGDVDPVAASCHQVAPDKTTTYYAWAADVHGKWTQRAVTLRVGGGAAQGNGP